MQQIIFWLKVILNVCLAKKKSDARKLKIFNIQACLNQYHYTFELFAYMKLGAMLI